MQIPQAFLDRMRCLLGDEYERFFASYTELPVPGLRVNTLKITPGKFQPLFPYRLSPIPWCLAGFTLPSDAQPGKHPFHAAGLYYLQDPSAMAPAELLAPRPGEWVLDLAAAPGGKATHLAALMANQGILVANEIHPRRAWELAENLERCGVINAAVLNENPHKLASHFGDRFDRVLVDAPCSGEGMFRKSQAAREEWSPELVQSCSIRQTAILEEAARLARPGGFLVYSTCTFAPEENELVVARFLDEHLDFSLVETGRFPGFAVGRPDWIGRETGENNPIKRTVRLWPHLGGPEGHFIAVMQRNGSARERGKEEDRRKRAQRLSPEVKSAFGAFWRETISSDPPEEGLAQQGTYLYRLPADLPDLAGLKVIHPGWWLGAMKKNRFEPSHALAMTLNAEEAQRLVRLSEQEALGYLRGETLLCDGRDGWSLITVRGNGMDFPLGWGKRTRGMVKNKYPKGLRWLA